MNDTPRDEDRSVAVEISDAMLRVTLRDGRIIATPLEWFRRWLTPRWNSSAALN